MAWGHSHHQGLCTQTLARLPGAFSLTKSVDCPYHVGAANPLRTNICRWQIYTLKTATPEQPSQGARDAAGLGPLPWPLPSSEGSENESGALGSTSCLSLASLPDSLSSQAAAQQDEQHFNNTR